ncbi:signal peptidase I [Microbacterium gubbeenense]|uniref:signal peptidase I n=1 Tax=Microbacterium gubbeenense TaxID=159896 RepID=UPI000569A2B4|nr:signal peptidase I [Microbacterium gubbeenense]
MTSESPTSPPARPPRGRGALAFVRDVIVIVVVAVLVSVLIKAFVVRSFYIPSASMEQTLMVDDKILVDELTVDWTGYERGDVVVFEDPGGWLEGAETEPPGGITGAIDWALNAVGLSASDSEDHLVKRIIGMPGDHVQCCNQLGQVTVNGAGIDELDYLNLPDGSTLASTQDFDVTVPEGAVWVMGDNRNRSRDSRYHNEQPGGGFVPIDKIVGRVVLRTWPLDRFGTLEHSTAAVGVPDAAQ